MMRIPLLLAVALSMLIGLGAAERKCERTVKQYTVPDVTLLNQDRQEIRLKEYLSEKPVILGFIFTTCTTICPIQGAMFSNMQKQLGRDIEEVRFVSISIDPENDTPERMKEFLVRYGAKPGWDFLTGSKQDIDRVGQAFEAYVPNKMSHSPLTYLKASGTGSWIRLNPYPTSAQLLGEIREVMGR